MKILLTGSSGMVGKNILEDPRCSEYIFLNPSSKELNLLDYKAIKDYLAINKPDIVIHAAGLVGGIKANINNNVDFLEVNLNIGINLLSASSQNNVKRFLNLGSSCMYPVNLSQPMKEDKLFSGALEPTNEGYALAKVTVAKFAEFLNKEEELNYKTIIPCNLYGDHDKFDSPDSHMIASVISRMHEAKIDKESTFKLWGDRKTRREFMYIKDFVDFIYFAINRFNDLPIYLNVGLGYDYSIEEYYKSISKVLDFNCEFVLDSSQPVGMRRKLVDTTNLEGLGWESRFSLNQGLEETYKYYLKLKSNEKI